MPSSFVIVPFFQAATLISPVINLPTILRKKNAIMIAAMILNAPILFSLGLLPRESASLYEAWQPDHTAYDLDAI